MMVKKYFGHLYKNVTQKSEEATLNFLSEPCNTFLDLGCWDGNNTIKFAGRLNAKNVLGVELDFQKAKMAASNGVNVIVGDLNQKFQHASNSVDVIMANHIIEHLTQTENFINEMYRVLKPGGYAIVATPNLASWHNVFALLIGLQPFTGPNIKLSTSDIEFIKEMDDKKSEDILEMTAASRDGLRHLVVMTYKEMTKHFRNAGFTVEKQQGFGYYPLPPLFAGILARFDVSHSHYILLRIRKERKEAICIDCGGFGYIKDNNLLYCMDCHEVKQNG